MSATDATNRPLNMPEHFIPYLDKHRIYKIFKVPNFLLLYFNFKRDFRFLQTLSSSSDAMVSSVRNNSDFMPGF